MRPINIHLSNNFEESQGSSRVGAGAGGGGLEAALKNHNCGWVVSAMSAVRERVSEIKQMRAALSSVLLLLF